MPVFAAKAVGTKTFVKDTHTKTTLLQAKSPETGKTMVTPEMEALIYILLDNNSIKWKNNIDLYLEKDNFKFEFPKKSKERRDRMPNW